MSDMLNNPIVEWINKGYINTSAKIGQSSNLILGSTTLKILYKDTGYADFLRYLSQQDEQNEKHFRLGTALDSLLCQNKEIEIFEIPKFDEDGKEFTRSKKGKDILKQKSEIGIVCLNTDDFNLVKNMQHAILEHPNASRFFEKNNPHIKFQHVLTEPYILENGITVTLRKTYDIAYLSDPNNPRSILFWCDLKTTCKKSHDGFISQFNQLDNDVQAGLYNHGLDMLDIDCMHEMLQCVDGAAMGYVNYIAVSTGGMPHVFVSKLSNETLLRGWEKCQIALSNLSQGIEKSRRNQYTGYTGVKTIYPSWKDKEEDDDEVKLGALV